MQATNSPDRSRIALLIEAEVAQLREFIALLQREEALLVSGDTDGLLAITHEKTERFRQLQALNDDRARLMVRCGHKTSDTSMRALFAQLPGVLARWNELLTLAGQAHTANALNGQLIAERMQHNQGAISVLLSAANHPQLYDAGGHSRPSGGGRILGSA